MGLEGAAEGMGGWKRARQKELDKVPSFISTILFHRFYVRTASDFPF